jgi:hypothetical protein
VTDSNRHRVSPLRHLALPPIHHQRPRIHQLHRATPDGTDLHHSFCPGSSSSMVQRSSGKAVSVCPRVYVHHGSRLHHVCCERDIYAGVFIAACALYPAFPGNITWLSNSEFLAVEIAVCNMLISFPDLAGSTKRATGQAIQIAVGNLAGGIFPLPILSL